MKGYLLIYRSRSQKSVVQLNHKLLGRIATVEKKGEKKRYYYPGELDGVYFKRLIKGCYFTTADIPIHDVELKKIKADVQLYEKDLVTGKGYWKNYARKNNWQVNNL